MDLKILRYRNIDEIEKLKKIKEDSDREMATMLQQLKTLSESRDLMQRELEQLKDAAQDVTGLVEINRLPWCGEASKSTWEFRKVRLRNHSTVRGTCTWVGEVLLATYST